VRGVWTIGEARSCHVDSAYPLTLSLSPWERGAEVLAESEQARGGWGGVMELDFVIGLVNFAAAALTLGGVAISLFKKTLRYGVSLTGHGFPEQGYTHSINGIEHG
jgi:hypothetical protein